MANYKKIDDRDFVFVNKPLSSKEEKEFTDFLKKRKSKIKAKIEMRNKAKGKLAQVLSTYKSEIKYPFKRTKKY